MKKLLVSIAIVFVSLPLFSQFDFSLGLAGGYEKNIFKNPSSYFHDDVLLTEDSLYANSFYNEALANVKYIKKWNDDVLKIKAYAGGAYYYNISEAHKYRYKLEVSYRTRYDDGKYFELAPQIFRIRKNGIDQTETILRTPYSYSKFLMPFNFDFYLGKKTWLKVQPAYLYKKYDTHAPERLYYHSWYINTELKKKWYEKKTLHQLSFVVDLSNRFYSDYELPKTDFLLDTMMLDDLTHKTRQWEYYTAKFVYSVKTRNDKFRLDLPVKMVYKNDKLTDFFSYFELSTGYNVGLNFKRFSFYQSASISNRDYSNFMIDDSTYLKYNYLSLAGGVKYDVSDVIELNLSGNLVKRFSNRTDNTKKYYREYYANYVEVGAKFRF